MTNNPTVQNGSPGPGTARTSGAGAIVALVLGTLLALVGVLGLVGAITSAVVTSRQGADGYFSSPLRPFSTNSFALTSPSAHVGADKLPFDLGSLRLDAASTAAGGQVFIGIGAKADVDKYLSNVHATEITGLSSSPFQVEYRDVPGAATPESPAGQGFWAVSAAGAGTQQITFDLRSGDWVVVIMNADARAGVSVNMRAGFHSELFGVITPALMVGAIVFLIVGAGLIALGAVGLGRRASSSGPGALGQGTSGHEDKVYPARLSGQLDPQLSRGLWLVKWLLAIPHFIILFFLWFALWVTTIIAGFAILFTGRYPRVLFDFAVGVLRWSWRVGFYAYSALGTDKYPPFTLASAVYPADFDVDYPQRLSRPLVLVKWWLLAIPHLLIISIFTSTAWATWGWRENWPSDAGRTAGFSLLGLLVLIAAIMLLFSGRYQRTLFNLIMGINRWIYRVATYVLLLRDDYPPFRLDQGPGEPGS